MSFKDNLRKQRGKANLSQEKLAFEISVSRQTISKWENGDSYPSTKHILMLAKILNCSMDELVDNEAENKQPISMIHYATPRKRYIYIVAGAVATLIVTIFGLAFSNFVNFETNNDTIDNSKIAVFDKIIDGSLDNALMVDGYTKKNIIGYGITEESGTFYIKCDLYSDGTGNPCPAIIYFCENNGDYSYKCQYLDNPDYIPKGEYYKVG